MSQFPKAPCRERASLTSAALALGAVLAGCSHSAEHVSKTGPEVPPPPVSVTVADIEQRVVERTVPIEGTLRAWEEVTVSAKKGGLVLRVHHDMGDRVHAGDVLVDLDPVDARLALNQAEATYWGQLVKLGISQEQAEAFVEKYGLGESLFRNEEVDALIRDLPAYKQAQANREKMRQQLARQQELYGRGVGTLQDLQNMQNDYAADDAALSNAMLVARTTVAEAMAARVALNVARQELADMVVAVPMPGTLPEGFSDTRALEFGVTRRAVREGQRIKDGEAVIDLVIEDPIRLWAPVPERYRPQIDVAQPVRLVAMSQPGQTFEGKVARINPAVDPNSRTFDVEALVPNPTGKLRPGGFAQGSIIVEHHDEAMVVPIESVYQFAGVTKIFLVDDGRARAYPVTLGRQVGEKVEVQTVAESPLPTSGSVVTTGQTALAEGTAVAIRQAAPDLSSVAPSGGVTQTEPPPAVETNAASEH